MVWLIRFSVAMPKIFKLQSGLRGNQRFSHSIPLVFAVTAHAGVRNQYFCSLWCLRDVAINMMCPSSADWWRKQLSSPIKPTLLPPYTKPTPRLRSSLLNSLPALLLTFCYAENASDNTLKIYRFDCEGIVVDSKCNLVLFTSPKKKQHPVLAKGFPLIGFDES